MLFISTIESIESVSDPLEYGLNFALPRELWEPHRDKFPGAEALDNKYFLSKQAFIWHRTIIFKPCFNTGIQKLFQAESTLKQVPLWSSCDWGLFSSSFSPVWNCSVRAQGVQKSEQFSPVHSPGLVPECRQSQIVASVCSAPRPTSLHLCPWKEILNNLILILTLPYTYRTWILLVFSVDHHPVGGVAINTVLNCGVELKWIRSN